ncbi:MAG TPA: malonate decarboxylase holo-[acyl-carrier-protein] synthase [Burkholderiaceae bacterium]|nr:malonate decarboxylase holo-[acyl-carrier-protein] synthase [Burkholderiaceae bacterium]
MSRPGRHAWVRISPGARLRLRADADDDRFDAVRAWLALGRPFVARARRDDDPPEQVPLALSRPRPSPGVPFCVEPDAVLGWSPPPPLRHAIGMLPPAWVEPARALDGALGALGVEAGVFGSAAWSLVAGSSRMTASSDLDLVVPVRDRASLDGALARLAAAQAGAPGRIDAECVWPDGRAAHWRELSAGGATVLTKSVDGAALERVDALRAALP